MIYTHMTGGGNVNSASHKIFHSKFPGLLDGQQQRRQQQWWVKTRSSISSQALVPAAAAAAMVVVAAVAELAPFIKN